MGNESKEITPNDLSDLSEDQLNSIDLDTSEDDKVVLPSNSKEEKTEIEEDPASKKEESKTDEDPESVKSEAEDKTKVEAEGEVEDKEEKQAVKKNFSEMTPEEKIEHVVHLEKRNKDLQAGFTRSNQKLKELERQQQARELEKAKKADPNFTPLSAEEMEDLRNNDPDTYIVEKEKNDAYEKAVQEDRENEIAFVKKAQAEEINEFAQEAFGVNVDSTKPFEEMTQEEKDSIKEFDSELGKVADFLSERKYPRLGGNGKYYTREQFMEAHFLVNRDTIIAREKLNAQNQIVDNIEKAGTKGSLLDKHPSSEKSRVQKKTAGDYDYEDIENMSEDEIMNLELE